ncbi:prenyltransferase [Oceanirhabdus sp. W0125-5]|uniref:prenyltransferase n=1 Tax=Oceanirhabdus sp. W0125-5 TaxID=2999116 RepID=UPI0022F2C9EF|nr:prenyltransferase [Oceanirhabdus sp. W0125-5]WBW97242.1 prenyltransferase [Oceanirhabdus sp. W0125-5]
MSIKSIIKLMDIKTLVAGVIPVLLGSTYSWYAYGQCNVVYLVLLMIAMILIQSGTNMTNDYFDFKRGADGEDKVHEKALVSGEITPKQVLFIIILFELTAFMIGVFLGSQTSYYILLVGITGGIIAILYASGPLPISYTPIGEIVSGVTMGIGITTTVIYIQSGVLNLSTVVVAIPTTLYIGTILLSNNLSDLDGDKEAGRRTLPIIIGRRNAEKLWVFNVMLVLILTGVLVFLGLYPIIVCAIVLLIFPYKCITDFLSYEKSIKTKGRTMGLIGKVGVKYHLAVIMGLLISIIFKAGI